MVCFLGSVTRHCRVPLHILSSNTLATDNMRPFYQHSILDQSPSAALRESWLLYALPMVIVYPMLVASLRYRRIRKSEKKQYSSRESLATMTDNEAFQIMNEMAELEFPTVFEKALQFALFRVGPPFSLTSYFQTRTT